MKIARNMSSSGHTAIDTSNRADAMSTSSTVQSVFLDPDLGVATLGDMQSHTRNIGAATQIIGLPVQEQATRIVPRQLFQPYLSTKFRRRGKLVAASKSRSGSNNKLAIIGFQANVPTPRPSKPAASNGDIRDLDDMDIGYYTPSKLNAESPSSQASNNYAPVVEQIGLADATEETSTVPITTQQSLSWTEASKRIQNGQLGILEDPLFDPLLDNLLAEAKSYKLNSPSLDGWELDRSQGRSLEQQENTDARKEGWSYVRSIPEEAIVELAMQHCPPEACSAKVKEFKDGMNNFAAIVEFDNGTKHCVRIPACGSKGVWNAAARATLLNVVDSMRFIKAKTALRIPEVIAYDDSFDNVICAPYVTMSFVPGRPLDDVWWDHDEIDKTHDFLAVSPELEKRRQNILKSIAHQVVKLKTLKFEHVGAFRLRDGDLNQPVIVTPKMRPFADVLATDEHNRRAKTISKLAPGLGNGGSSVCSTSSLASFSETGLYTSWYDMLNDQLHDWYSHAIDSASRNDVFHSPDHNPSTDRIRGTYQLYCILLNYFPYAPGTKTQYPESELFTLSHTDFNPQNIFVSDDGTDDVTGFIDWDYTDTKPRYVGWARQPVWLCEDWDPELAGGSIAWPDRTLPASCELERYRKDYARYLMEACGPDDDDWRFALKCHLFDAVCVSMGKTRDMQTFLIKILDTYVGTFDWDRHLSELGRDGFKPGLEAWYHDFFQKLFDCDPRAVKKELGVTDMDLRREIRVMAYNMQQTNRAHESVQKAQGELMDLYKKQLAESRRQVERLEHAFANEQGRANVREEEAQSESTSRSKAYYGNECDGQRLKDLSAPGVLWHEWNEAEEYLMRGALKPLTPDHHESSPNNLITSPPLPVRPLVLHKKLSPWKKVLKRLNAHLQLPEIKDAQANPTLHKPSGIQSLAANRHEQRQNSITERPGVSSSSQGYTSKRNSGLGPRATAKGLKKGAKDAYHKWKMHNDETKRAWDLYTYGAYDPDQYDN